MRILRRLAAVLPVLVLAASAVPAAPQFVPISAAEAIPPHSVVDLRTGEQVTGALAERLLDGCPPNPPNGTLCLFNGGRFAELLAGISYASPTGYCVELASYVDNKTDYVINSTFYAYTPWTGDNCTGTSGIFYERAEGAMGGIWRDNIESVQRRAS